MSSLYLASTSPRRRTLLARLGVPFQVVAPPFEEIPTGRPPKLECLYFAEQKARAAALAIKKDGGRGCILAADTLIACQGEILGKPQDDADAFRILRKLSGKTHEVHTAVALVDSESEELLRDGVETARVRFRPLTDDEIRAYVSTGEPTGKAGAYAVQGRARKLLIENVEGDEEAVIGLPVALVAKWLQELGFAR
jgi:septum formation protein